MIAPEKLVAAHIRTASYYLDLLHEMNQAYLSGGENTYYALQRLEVDYNQIERSLEWLERHLAQNSIAARLFMDMVAAGQYILSRRLTPVDYRQLHEKALDIAEELQDSDAALRHLSAIANAYQMQKNTAQFHETLLQIYNIAKKVGNTEQIAATLFSLALVYMDWGQLDDALQPIQEALYHYELLNDTANVGKCLIRLGKINLFKGNWAEAEFCYNEAYGIAIQYNYPDHLLLILRNLGEVKGCTGLYDEAIQFQLRALEIASRSNDKAAMIPLLMQIGNWHDYKGEYTTARTYHHQGLELMEQTGISRYKSYTLCYFGLSFSLQGDNANAVGYLEEALQMFRRERDMSMLCITLSYLAPVYAGLGHISTAQETLFEAIGIAQETENQQLQRRVVITVVRVWVVLAFMQSDEMKQERMQQASLWFGLSASLPNVVQELLNELDKLRPQLEATLGQKQFNDLLQQGELLTLSDVLNDLRDELQKPDFIVV